MSRHTYFRGSTDNALVESHGDGFAYVAFYRDGEILGVRSGMRDEIPFETWIGDQELVDHPELETWKRQLADLHSFSEQLDVDVKELVRAARGFPFQKAVERALRQWTNRDSRRAAAVLDHIEELQVGDFFVTELAQSAAEAPAHDARVERWLRGLLNHDHDEALIAVVRRALLGPLSAEVVLSDIDEVPSSQRSEVYDAIAAQLARDPAQAMRLVVAVDELPSSDEASALNRVLDGGAASPEFVRAVLRCIDERPSSSRLEVFRKALKWACSDRTSYHAVVSALGELPSSARAVAALDVVDEPGASEELVALLVDHLDTLPSRFREEVLMRILESRHASSSRVSRACERAAEESLSSRARKRVMERVRR